MRNEEATGRSRSFRRAATDKEVERLLASLRGTVAGLTAERRYYLYLTALETGFRAKELSVLTPFHFRLTSKPRTIRLAATNTKNRQEADYAWAQRRIEGYYRRLHLPLMRRTLMGEECATPANDWPYRQELVFFLAVAMPCWLEYGTTPWELFLQARRGDFRALEKLVRLDSEVDKEETLAPVVFRLRGENPAQHELILHAKHEGRKKPISLKSIKYSLGGLLMRWSKELHDLARGELLFQTLEARVDDAHRRQLRKWIKAEREARERTAPKCWLKAPDIVGLFNAIAQDTAEGLIDSDFVGYPNTIYKQLARNAKPWPALWEADKSHAA